MGIVERSGGFARKAVVSAALACACLAAALAPASAPARLAQSVSSGTTHIVLDPKLYRALRSEGVRVVGLGRAEVRGRVITMPLEEGYFEYGHGSGYAFGVGGIAFRRGKRAAVLRGIVLNTAKDRFNVRIGGRSTVLGNPDGVSGRPTHYGLEIVVRRLLLTGAGARSLDRALHLRRVFLTGAPLARVRVAGQTETVPITGAALDLTLDEGFAAKLAALGVAVSADSPAAQTGSAPLAFAFPEARGEANRDLDTGRLFTRTALRLSRGAFPDLHEATVELSLSFESALVGTVRERAPAAAGGAPFGEADFAATTALDPATGLLAAAPTPVTLAAYGVSQLNEAFAAGYPQQFIAGEPVGTLSFSGRLGNWGGG